MIGLLLSIALAWGFTPNDCTVGSATAIFEDMSYTTNSNQNSLTCATISEGEFDILIIDLMPDGTYWLESYQWIDGNPFPESVQQYIVNRRIAY